MNLLASLRRLVNKPLPLPERIDIRIERRGLRLDEDGDTVGDYAVLVDGKEVTGGEVCLPAHDPDCKCDLMSGLHKMVMIGALSDLIGIKTIFARRAHDGVIRIAGAPHSAPAPSGERPS